MSLSLEILKKAARITKRRSKFEGSPDEVIARAKENNSRISVPDLQDEDFLINRIEVSGFPVVRMLHKKKSLRACIFFIGGGSVNAPIPDSVKKALKLAKETGLDFFVPYFPLCTEYPVDTAYDMVYMTYLEMLKTYEAENITVFGTSSGASLALGLISYINCEKKDAPMPGRVVAVSPGTCIATEEEKKKVLELDEKDFAIPAQYIFNVEEIMRKGKTDIPDYMLRLQNGDYTGCPETVFIYGTDEILYAFRDSFENVMQKYNVKYRMIIGEGLYHCYPFVPFCKEGAEGWKMLSGLLAE